MNFKDLIGKPFHEDGYGPDNYSCYGLLVEVFKRYGINIPKVNISVCACKETSQKKIQKELLKVWQPMKKKQAPAGILIRSTNPDYADHLGVYIGAGKMIHITPKRNVVIDRVQNWQDKIIGYYQYVGNSKGKECK